MRVLVAIVAASLAGKAQACLTVHAFLGTSPYTDDPVVIQLWDKPEGESEWEVFVKDAEPAFFSDSEDQFCVEDDTYKVCVRQNTKQGDVWNKYHDYYSELTLVNTHFNSYCCLYSASDNCLLNCGDYESCLNDGWGCDSCGLCDFRSYCSAHKLFRRDDELQSRKHEGPARRAEIEARRVELEARSMEMQKAWVAEHGEEALEALVQRFRDSPVPGIEVVG